MFRFTLRKKLLVFAVAIAILPLGVAGQSLIRIAQDEMKSSANDQLSITARQITGEIDSVVKQAWEPSLLLFRNAVDDEQLGPHEKLSLLAKGVASLPDLVALQITVEGAVRPFVARRADFESRLIKAKVNPSVVLVSEPESIFKIADAIDSYRPEVTYVKETDDWLATLVLPLRNPLGGQRAVLSARVNLARIRHHVEGHPFAKSGSIFIVDKSGREVFDKAGTDLSNYPIVEEAKSLIGSPTRVAPVTPYVRPDGQAMLGSFALPEAFDWAVIADKSEAGAYAAVNLMLRSLAIWVAGGLAIAIIGAMFFALGISRPILKIGTVAMQVAQGNFRIRVEGVKARDEIGDLATRFNDMIVQLGERFQLAKFVSHDTMEAIRKSDDEGVKLGGDRQEVAILFADIRGYTAFSENREPEEVVDVLNGYFQTQADIVHRHNGDIDKFVGDQIMAVFHGPDMALDVVKCCLEIQDDMRRVNVEHPDRNLEIGIGADLGSVVVGAMGSDKRMDYTVLGDKVNTAARLCSAAAPQQTLISEDVVARLPEDHGFALTPLEPLSLKGKSEPMPIYDVKPGA